MSENKSEKTPEQRKQEHDRLMAARAAALDGRSPRAVGEERAAMALEWVYRWGWSSPSLLDHLAGGTRRGLTARLVKAGLLVATRTEAGGVVRGVPVYLITLSRAGLAEVERTREELVEYRLDPSRIWQGQLRHDLFAQEATFHSLNAFEIDAFETPSEQAAKSEEAEKQPDVIWHRWGAGRIGVEIELSARWGRQLDQFVRATIRSMHSRLGDKALKETKIISDSPAILRRYEKAFAQGASYWKWEKGERSAVWKKTEKFPIPEWMVDKVSFVPV